MTEGMHQLARRVKKGRKGWTRGIREMQEALRESTRSKISLDGRRILAESGEDPETPERAYTRL